MTNASRSESPPNDRSGPASTLDPVLRLAHAVAGALRPASVVDRLALEVKATFGPQPAGAVTIDEQGHRESANGDAGHPVLGPLLARVLQQGTLLADSLPSGQAVAVPLMGRQSIVGALAFLFPREPAPAELRLLECLGAIAAVAIESARLVEASEARLHAWEDAAEAVSLGLCILDQTGRVERGNRAFAELISAPNGVVRGLQWTELLPREWHADIAAVLGAAGPKEADLRIGPRTIAVTAFRTAPSTVGRQVLVFADETDRRRLQDRLIQSEKLTAIGQLIAGVAHDLNNPLTSVIGFADFLAESPDAPARMREPLRVVQQEAERASKIVKNLLSFARRQEARQPASLGPILEATVGLFRNNLSAEQVTLEIEITGTLPELDLNPTQIQQVFVNLIQNAAQAITASGRPGTIRVRARPWIDGVAVDVSDNGPGMPPDVAGRVFEPFFTTKPPGAGTGLGLSISQGIVKEHGGRITLVTAPGDGATFTVELPGRVPTGEKIPEPVANETLSPRRVLVIDDEPHILHYIRATLEAWGHEVVTASDGQSGLDIAIAQHFDLIISDLRMPRVGGREFYESLRERKPEAARRVAFSTGDTVRGDTLDFLEAQGRPVLHKPFSLAELRRLLQRAATG
jgi:two-component system NtrC family sensor kinase